MTDRDFKPPQTQALDALLKAYEKIGDKPMWANAPEAKFDDEPESSDDPWFRAKEMAERLVRMLIVISMSFSGKATDMIFAMELASLNVLNAEDCPLPREEILKIRELAFNYYRDNLAKVPGKR